MDFLQVPNDLDILLDRDDSQIQIEKDESTKSVTQNLKDNQLTQVQFIPVIDRLFTSKNEKGQMFEMKELLSYLI